MFYESIGALDQLWQINRQDMKTSWESGMGLVINLRQRCGVGLIRNENISTQ